MHRPHRRRRAALALLASSWLALGAVAVVRTRPTVEHDLAERARRAVSLGGYRDVRVRYSGRDAVLHGVVRSEVDRRRVAAIVRARPGTRAVDASALVVHAGAPAPEPVGSAAP